MWHKIAYVIVKFFFVLFWRRASKAIGILP